MSPPLHSEDWQQADVSIAFAEDWAPPTFGDIVQLHQFRAGIHQIVAYVRNKGATELERLDLPAQAEAAWREMIDGVPVRCICAYVPFPIDGDYPGFRGRISVRYRGVHPSEQD